MTQLLLAALRTIENQRVQLAVAEARLADAETKLARNESKLDEATRKLVGLEAEAKTLKEMAARLELEAKTLRVTTTATKPAPATATVKSGDTLWGLWMANYGKVPTRDQITAFADSHGLNHWVDSQGRLIVIIHAGQTFDMSEAFAPLTT